MALVSRGVGLVDYLDLSRDFEPGWLYHGPAWLSAIRDGFQAEVAGLVTETAAGEAIALTPLMRIRKGIFQLVGSPLRGMYTEFAGPLFKRDARQILRREAIISQHAYLKANGASYIEWGLRGRESEEPTDDFAVLRAYRYDHSPRPSLVIDIGQGIEKVWGAFESRARNMVRKAEKNAVHVRSIVPTENDVTSYYNMLSATFRSQGLRVPHPKSFFHATCEHLSRSSNLQFFTAEKNCNVVAGAIFLHQGDRMMYMSGTSTEEGARFAANSLLQWEAMKRASDIGVSEFDLGGIGMSTIDKFKASFGGKYRCHHRWIYRSWPIRIAERAFAKLAMKGWLRFHD